MNKNESLVFPFGCGVNSVALAILLVQKNIVPDYILFANTGGFSNLGEKHETYRYKRFFSNWLKSKGFPEIKTVVYNEEGLYREMIRLKTLPSIAFGWKTCSIKWKIYSSDNYLKSKKVADRKKIIGYDAGEGHRSKTDYTEEGVSFWYPLVDWDIDRMDCVKIIIDAGLPLPPKSSCFFCPNMNAWEIHQLKEEDPCRFDKAIEMEQNAKEKLTAVRGLGRKGNKKWSEIIQQQLLPMPEDIQFELERMPCQCSL
jgi:hypothetical protein